MADVSVVDGGSVWLLTPQSRQARKWFDENIGADNGFQPYWPTAVVEHRYVQDILHGLEAAGLKVSNGKLSEAGRKFLTQ